MFGPSELLRSLAVFPSDRAVNQLVDRSFPSNARITFVSPLSKPIWMWFVEAVKTIKASRCALCNIKCSPEVQPRGVDHRSETYDSISNLCNALQLDVSDAVSSVARLRHVSGDQVDC